MRPAQFAFGFSRSRLAHGGDIRRGRRKTIRPIDPKRPLHVIMKSSRAKGALSLLARPRSIRGIFDSVGKRKGVRVLDYANVGNHIHLVILGRSRRDIQAFLRSSAGLVARLMTGARKGGPFGKFWDQLVFTRVIAWGRGLKTVRAYILKNRIEAGEFCEVAASRKWSKESPS